MDDEGVWTLHNKQPVPASSLLYPDVVGHGLPFGEASSNLLSTAHVDIEACRIDKHGLESELIESYDDLVFYFETSKSCQASPDWDGLQEDSPVLSERSSVVDGSDHGAEAEIFFISEMHPHSRLAVSEPAMKRLLSQYEVFSSFTDILTLFAIGAGNYNEGGTGLYTSAMTKIPRDQNMAELCYVLKCVEPDPASLSLVPWSLRQMGIYQKVDLKTQDTKCILIQPSTEFHRRKTEITDSITACQDLSEHWTSLHCLLVGTLNRNWGSYLKCLDLGVDRVHSTLFGAVMPRFTTATMQEISGFIDLLQRFIHVQRLNLEVFNMLLAESKRPGGREEFDKKDFSCRYRALEWALDTSISETKILCSHAELVLRRANTAVAMLRDLTAIENNQLIRDMARRNPQTIVQSPPRDDIPLPIISHQQTRDIPRDNRSTKTMTLIMLVYLPLILTSTFLSMGFIHVTSAHNGLTLEIDDDMWFFLALILPLIIVTLVAWYFWEWRARRRRLSHDLEDNVKLE